MREKYTVQKPETVKIIQAFSHALSHSHHDWSTAKFKILGLGDDGKIYDHDEYSNTWHREDIREVPDACTCNQQPMQIYGVMPCWFCTKKIFDRVDKNIKSKTETV